MSRYGVSTRNTIVTRAAPEKAILVAVAPKGARKGETAETSIEELAQLATTAGATIAGKVVQQMAAPSKTHYIGKGKLDELLEMKNTLDYNVAIFDDELSPLQQRNLEESLKVKVIDRVSLILDIFARRARTSEGRLQVELAQYQYLLPRLAGQWAHLERLGGGIGTRGPGESQLETDRRIISQKIHRLKAKIEDIRKHRSLYRQRRQKTGIPVVALVGYTNAGKSTLFNALCHAEVFTEDKLFATLDPTTRRLALPDKRIVLVTDTVGFIRKLPPAIVSAFRATLEELGEADLLLHVVDLASPDAAGQCQSVQGVLAKLDLKDKPVITVLNKTDLLMDDSEVNRVAASITRLTGHCPVNADTIVPVSAVRGWGLSQLVEVISRSLP